MDAPSPQIQFDDKSQLEKARRRAIVNPTESRNTVVGSSGLRIIKKGGLN